MHKMFTKTTWCMAWYVTGALLALLRHILCTYKPFKRNKKTSYIFCHIFCLKKYLLLWLYKWYHLLSKIFNLVLYVCHFFVCSIFFLICNCHFCHIIFPSSKIQNVVLVLSSHPVYHSIQLCETITYRDEYTNVKWHPCQKMYSKSFSLEYSYKAKLSTVYFHFPPKYIFIKLGRGYSDQRASSK